MGNNASAAGANLKKVGKFGGRKAKPQALPTSQDGDVLVRDHGHRRSSNPILQTPGGGDHGGRRLSREEKNALFQSQLLMAIGESVLNDDQIKDIHACWVHMEKHMNDILTEAFLALFTEHPDIKDKFFDFRNHTIEDLRNKSNQTSATHPASAGSLHRHVPRVARAISKVVYNLDNLVKIAEYLQILGKLHNQNGIKTQEMALLGPYFVSSAVCHLPSELRERRFQEAWIKLFQVINRLMMRGYPEVELVLSPAEKDLIRTSFKVVKERTASLGDEAAIIKLSSQTNTTTMANNLQLIRNLDPEDEHALAEAMATHGMLLIKVAEDLVKELDNKPAFDEYCMLLGRFHEKCDVRRDLFDVMGPFFCQIVGPILRATGMWNNETKEVWLHLFRIISYHMKKGYVHTSRRSSNTSSSKHSLHHLRSLSASATPIIRLSPDKTRPGQRLCLADRSPGSKSSGIGGGHLFQKNHNIRRISMDELRDDSEESHRRVRLQAQHCHLFHHNYNNNHLRANSLSVQDPDMVYTDRRWSGSLGLMTGSSAALIIRANMAAAEAAKEAKARRRSSLHQLLTFGTKSASSSTGSSNDGSSKGGRPRSRSAPFTNIFVKQQT